MKARANTKHPGVASSELVEAVECDTSGRCRSDRVLGDALLRARGGQEDGFVLLWGAFQPRLLRYLALRGETTPEDIAAETWLQVIRDLERFEGGLVEFRSWLYAIARHRAVDQGRARAARPEEAHAELESGEVVRSAEEDALEGMSTHSACQLVATLPREQAEMVMLRVVVGLDVGKVADLVGKRPGTVRVAVHRGLRTLAGRIGA